MKPWVKADRQEDLGREVRNQGPLSLGALVSGSLEGSLAAFQETLHIQDVTGQPRERGVKLPSSTFLQTYTSQCSPAQGKGTQVSF